MATSELKKDQMMAHLLAALEAGKDIGEYGRLVFVMVGRHFLGEEELVKHLRKNLDDADARALVRQVEERGYNPPRREKILEWQKQQKFPICPEGDPDACNVYRNLPLPDEVFEKIGEYRRQKAES